MDPKLKAGAVFKPHELHRDATFEEEPPNYLWCLHCERAYVPGEYRPVRDLQMSPYADCDGDTVIDAWSWESIREDNPSYPENPIEGTVYPMHGTSGAL